MQFFPFDDPMLVSQTSAIAFLFLLGISAALAESIDVGVVDSRADATHPILLERVHYPFGERTDLNIDPHVHPRVPAARDTTRERLELIHLQLAFSATNPASVEVELVA